MPILRRRALLGATSASLLATPALAFPERTLRIISGYAPGGLNDIISRAMAQALTPVLGQSVVVENRAGAGGAVGAAAAARSPADGHTLWMGIVDTQAIIPTAYRTQLYDPTATSRRSAWSRISPSPWWSARPGRRSATSRA